MRTRKPVGLVAIGIATSLLLAACGSDEKKASTTEAPSAGSAAPAPTDEKVELTFLVDDRPAIDTQMKTVTDAYTAKHPNVTFKIELRPGGADGDNIVKTKLATGTMNDIFFYNSGSLLQALKPAESILDLSGSPAIANVQESFLPSVTQDGKVYGVPAGSGMGGGILYNMKVYEKLGLKVPTTWDEFAANNDKIKAAGITAVEATYADTWTSQLFVLADFYNVNLADPKWADNYTANKAKYADTPAAIVGFEHLAEAFDKGWYNEDFGSAKFDQGIADLTDGKAAHYPMLTFALASMDPAKVNDIGFFGQPGTDATKQGITLWMPAAAYIAKGTKHPAEAKDFLAFLASAEGMDILNAAAPPGGPLLIKGAKLPATVPPVVSQMQAAVDAGKVFPALEFLSPVKGPNLEKITVEVGSGLKDPKAAAADYDADVEKQAKQLGLPGW